MGYLEEFQVQINNRDFNKFLQLWEEYVTSDTVEPEEFTDLLKAIKNSELSRQFGRIVETAIPLWQTIQDPDASYTLFKHLIDLQTTNSPTLADLSLQVLKKKHGENDQFFDRIRLVGLRSRENFQGAISNYDLLAHMAKGKFVFHTGGWGAGEIVDLSNVREQVSIEFEHVPGRKHFNFSNAFKTLIPLGDDHFLMRRFANPDVLEKEAKEDPVAVIKVLLRDLGPKNASEIKDELCELVIPDAEWTKWWQSTRTKIKKDPIIETPANLKDPFRLRKSEMTQEERLQKAIKGKTDIGDFIQSAYNFVRDLPNMRKHQDVKNSLKDKLVESLSNSDLTKEQELQICILLENMFSHHVEGRKTDDLIKKIEHIEETIHAIDILALKKKALTLVQEHRKDWEQVYLKMLFSVPQAPLKDFLFKELHQGPGKKLLHQKIKELIAHPTMSPETFIWYFQKIVSKEEEGLPYSNKEGQCQLLESFLILFSAIESKPEYRELTKKIYSLLSGKRYAIVRSIIEGTSLDFIQEFLLLVSKCQTLSDHDIKILRSLAEVVHPSLAQNKTRKSKHMDGNTIWTSEEGYLRTHERIKHLGTIEIVENAREIEAARALGDLRENSEYKFALEKRSRLQGELKRLSEQLHRARILTKDDIHRDEVGIGSIVALTDPQGKAITYTILGPWDADPDNHILSFQSKFAEAMMGCKEGETFRFRDEVYSVSKLKSFFEK